MQLVHCVRLVYEASTSQCGYYVKLVHLSVASI